MLDHPQNADYRETLGRPEGTIWPTARKRPVITLRPKSPFVLRSNLFQQLVKESPEKRDYRYRLAVCQNGLAVLLGDLGRQEEAVAVFREALESSRQRVRDFPYIPDYRAGLADAHCNLALQLETMGRYEEAEKTYGEAILVDKQLVDEFPKVPKYRSGLAIDYSNLGGLLGTLDRFDEAEKADRAALEIRQQLAKDYPNDPRLPHGTGRTATTIWRIELVKPRNRTEPRGGRASTGRPSRCISSWRRTSPPWRTIGGDWQSGGGTWDSCSSISNATQEAEESFRQGDRDHRAARARRERPARRPTVALPAARAAGPIALRDGTPWRSGGVAAGRPQVSASSSPSSPPCPSTGVLVVECHINLGACSRQLRRLPEAVEIRRAALEMAKKLAADYPSPSIAWLSGGATTTSGAGSVVNADEQEAVYRAAIGVLEKLVAEYPAPEEYRLQCRVGVPQLGAPPQRFRPAGRSPRLLEEGSRRAGDPHQGLPRQSRSRPGSRGRAKRVGRVGQGDRPEEAEPSPNSGTEPETPKTAPKKEKTEELPKSTPAPEPRKKGATKVR